MTVSDWTQSEDINDDENNVNKNDDPDDTVKVAAPAAPDEGDEEGDSQETTGGEGEAEDAVVVTEIPCTRE